MKKLTISISNEAHNELLKIQLRKKIEKKDKTSLAEIAAEVIEEALTNPKK